MRNMYQSINPSNQEELKSFKTLHANQLEQKLIDAESSFKTWRAYTFDQRAEIIQKFADRFEAKRKELAKMISLEMGKPLDQALGEVDKCVLLCKYTAEIAASRLADRIIETDNHKEAHIWYQPVGAVLGVMPWNFPYWQALRFAIPALMAGNVVFLKPAPNVPQCGALIETIFKEVAPDLHIFHTIFVTNEQVAKLLEHPFIQGVALTGSEKAGSAVASKAAAEIKKSVLELGGSDAFIVLEDADLFSAASTGVLSRMNNSGQTCIAAKRFIVVESVADAFIQELKNNIIRLQVGNPLHSNTDIGPLARKDLLKKLQNQVDTTIAAGAAVLIDGGTMEGKKGNFFSPMLLSGVKKGMTAYTEELFGPVAVVYSVKNDTEAIALANDTSFGLGAAVWSNNIERAKAVAKKLEAGAIAINEMVKSDPRLPFGGIKRSGFGREMAEEGLKEFVNIKTVIIG